MNSGYDGRIPVFNRSKQIRPTKNSASYECYHSVRTKESEHGSVLLCDPTHHSIILQTTAISCCACSAPHAELGHLSTSINGRHRYRLDKARHRLQPLCATVLHSAGSLACHLANYPVPRTNFSHYILLALRTLPSPVNLRAEAGTRMRGQLYYVWLLFILID